MSRSLRFESAGRFFRLFVIAAFGATVVTSAALSPATAAAQDGPGGIGIRLAEAPIAAKDDPRARIYIVDHVGPGSMIERRIEVSNSTTAAHQVDLYSSAATIEDGVFVGAERSTENDVSRWTTVAPGAIEIAAGEKRIALVKISVPSDAAPGEQYGVVWAETRSQPAAGGVTQVSRVGIRLYLSVGSGAPPAADFTVAALTPGRSADGEPVITATVRNTGGRAIDVAGTLAMSNGPGGLSAGPFPAELNTTLAVGDTEKVTITLDSRLPAGPWDAVVALKSGTTERSGEATITFPETGEAAPVRTQTESESSWLLIGGTSAVVIALGAVGWHQLRRIRRPRLATATPAHQT